MRGSVLGQVRPDHRLRPGVDVILADGTLVTLGGKGIKDVAGLSLRGGQAGTASVED
jgi:hypothetical protein